MKLIIIAFISSVMLMSCSNYTTGWCDREKTIKYFQYKKPEKAWIEYKRQWQVGIENTLELLKGVDSTKITSNISLRDSIISFREKLNQENIFIENVLKAAWFNMNGNPCDLSIRRDYSNLIQSIATNNKIIEGFIASATSTTKGPENTEITITKNIKVLEQSIKNTSNFILFKE